jgi:dye decolorizing peroxidase
MNAADGPHHHPAVGLRANHGINAFMEVVSRATFAVPARAQRAYPAQVLTVAGQVSQAA